MPWWWLVACVVRSRPPTEVLAAPPTGATDATTATPVIAVPTPPAPPPPDLVDVAVPREFRGLWVATVSNLDFPSRTGLSADQARAELVTLAQTAHDRGFNALVFQVRPEADAVYASTLEPWSRFLTGHQGGDPGFDPLAVLIEEAHSLGIEVHAWFNPYRAAIDRGATTADGHVSRWAGDAVCAWGALAWMDPGAEALRAHTLKVIDDVVGRYAIDGVHLDDYFYPYPIDGKTFPDGPRYTAYCDGGGALDRAAWRRQNVDLLVEAIAREVAATRPDCRFGISPFGIYRPGQPAGIRGMDQVTALNADPLRWYREDWVDYLAPQLYWPTTKEAQRYDRLLGWWNDQVTEDRPLLVGLDVTKVGHDPAWTLDEVRAQVTLSRAAARTAGQIWFRATPVLTNQAGLGDLLAELYASPALPPPTPGLDAVAAPVSVRVEPGRVAIDDPDPTSTRAYVLYRAAGDAPVVDRIVPPREAAFALQPGVWAVSAVRAGAIESRALRFTVR
ncbi:MAG: family 10 glycosylhydrolase [Myxococcota bacterium]